MSATLLEVRNLDRRYGKVHAVRDLSFTMERGQITGFVGPNGAGKTTTMRIAATLDVPDSGDVEVDGVSVLVEPRQARLRIGYMSDQFHPYPNLDILEYLDFFARAYGLRGKQRKDTVQSVAHFCGLLEFKDRPATGLSKGMGQRLHLAKTLLHDPQLLILDEPASGLDPRARIEFRALLKELAAAGKGILISSHILPELGEMCDSVVVIERGERIVSGSIQDIQKAAELEQAIVARVNGDVEALERFLLVQPHVSDVVADGSRVRFAFRGDDEAMGDLLARAIGQELRIVEFARAALAPSTPSVEAAPRQAEDLAESRHGVVRLLRLDQLEELSPSLAKKAAAFFSSSRSSRSRFTSLRSRSSSCISLSFGAGHSSESDGSRTPSRSALRIHRLTELSDTPSSSLTCLIEPISR